MNTYSAKTVYVTNKTGMRLNVAVKPTENGQIEIVISAAEEKGMSILKIANACMLLVLAMMIGLLVFHQVEVPILMPLACVGTAIAVVFLD